MAWQFCFENLLFTWFENEDVSQQEFTQFALLRISPYTVDSIYFRPVCDGFYYSCQQLWSKMRLSRPPSSEAIKSLEQIKQEDVKAMPTFLKPLVLVSERIMKYFTKDPQQYQQQYQFQDQQQLTYAQQSLPSVKIEGMENETQTLKQISKLTEDSLPVDVVENAYTYVSQFLKKTYQNCQVAKSFIVNIIEINHDVLNKFTLEQVNQGVKVRIMQPSTLVYDSLLSIWSLALSSQSAQQPQFYDLIGRTKALLGDNWKETYQNPVEIFYETLSAIYQQILLNPQIRQEEQLKILINSLRCKLQQVWEIEIVNKTYD